MSVAAGTYDPALEQQLPVTRGRGAYRVAGREAIGRTLMAAAFFAAALPLALIAHPQRHPVWWLYPAFVAAYAVVSAIRIEVGSGVALPTAVVFVPMLFLLPVAYAPLLVAAGLVAGALPDVVRRQLSPARAAVLPASAFFALGPALVFLAAHEPRADWHGGGVLALALGAQLVFSLAGSCICEWVALGARPLELLRPLVAAMGVDALIAPFAFGMTIAERVQHGALLLPLPIVGFLALFARERRERLDSALELSAAYRGTALLLGDVVEADNAYTGDHSRQVVELVVNVCDQLGLEPRERRVAEFTALLHDVGKLWIPPEIINKPGPLTSTERRILDRHTLDGERLLLQVGGLLADVGRLVRSCHERWDGGGYPDGLAGDEIPLIARIVCCCDAYNAMTTDRPYRPALSQHEAMAELFANRGTQFDPAVVDALAAVVAA